MQSHWDSRFNEEESIEKLRTLALLHLEDVLQEPQCAYLADLIDRRDWRAVVEFEPRYDDGGDVYSYIALRQALAFFSKNQGLKSAVGIDTRQVALSKFEEAETLCSLTNEAFTAWEEGRFQFDRLVESVLHGSARKISQILGELPQLSSLVFRFGPGASASIPKRLAHARLKLSTGVQCSEDLLPLVPRVLREVPAYLDSLPGEEYEAAGWEWKSVPCQIQAGRLDFVAKSAKTDRAIVVEPLLNTFVQQGIGLAIADRLARHGQDIHDSTRNARLAREGSLTGALATLDLSSASDTISKELVKHLLPYDWWELMLHARTSSVRYGDRLFELEKFSSMGNGFTFPLETLIFYALAVATCDDLGVRGPISVYGDDIILPTEAAVPYVKVLRALGFVPNPSKSFWTGPFRESCGKDYYRGIDIRPIYVKDVLTVATAFVIHNYYVRRLQPDFASRVLNWIPSHLRLWGPSGYGDGHLHGKWEGVRHPKSGSHGYSGWLFETWSFTAPKARSVLPGDFLFPGYAVYLRHGAQSEEPADIQKRCQHEGSSFWRNVRDAISDSEQTPIDYQTRDRKVKGMARWLWNTSLPGTASVKKLSIYTLESPDSFF